MLSRSSEIRPSEDEEAAMYSQRNRGCTVAVIRDANNNPLSPLRPRAMRDDSNNASNSSSPTAVANTNSNSNINNAKSDELEKLKTVARENRNITRVWQVLMLDIRLVYVVPIASLFFVFCNNNNNQIGIVLPNVLVPMHRR
jgi:hypothetical protein